MPPLLEHLWVERSYVIWPNQKKMLFFIILNNNELILTSTLAAGRVPDAFAREAGDAKRRRLEATSTAHAPFLST